MGAAAVTRADEILRRRGSGEPFRKIAHDLELSVGTVHGVAARGRVRPAPDERAVSREGAGGASARDDLNGRPPP